MALTRLERETIIRFNEEEKTAWVHCFDGPMKRQLQQLAQERPDQCRLLREYDEGEARYEVPKSWVMKIRPNRILSDAEKARLSENGRRAAERLHGNAS